MTSSTKWLNVCLGVACGVAGFALFQFWGNATHGYIATDSLFYWWGFQWVNPESETQHAWLILGISVYLLSRNLYRIKGGEGPDLVRAAAALLAGILLHTIGFVAQQPRISIVGLLFFAWGVLAVGGGRRWGSASMFPLGFLVFAIPVNALDTLGFWLRMWVVRSGGWAAHLFGIGVLRNGTQLFSGDGRYQYDVVAACSGTRSLMALTALSLFIGYVWFRPIWLRAAMLALSFPLVYVGNVIRITAIIIAAQWGGQKWGNVVHDVMGYGVFGIVLGGIIFSAEWISRRKPRWTGAAFPNVAAPLRVPAGAGLAVVIAAILAVGADAGFLSHRASMPVVERPGVILASDSLNPVELPTYLGSEWMGRHVEPTLMERAILPPDTGYSRKLYFNLENPQIQVLLSIVLSGRDRTSIHRPELCLVGQGWSIDGTSSHHFAYPGVPTAGIEATVLNVHREVPGPKGVRSVPEIVVYWFVGDGRVVPSQGQRMLYDAFSRVFEGRACRWTYVLLQTGSSDGQDNALSRIQSILNLSLGSFQPAFADN